MKYTYLDGNSLTIESIKTCLDENHLLAIHKQSIPKIQASRAIVDKAIANNQVVYGINTGFGLLSNVSINKNDLAQLQENLIKSHATGLGNLLPKEICKTILLLRANVLCKGFSGVRLELIERLIALYNNDIIPAIPEKGSVGACGDLAPLAHLSLPLLGMGEVYWKNEIVESAKALSECNLEPIVLAAKEGLALINGTQTMTGIGVHAITRAQNLATVGDIIAATTLDALHGTLSAFDIDVQRVRPHQGQMTVAQNFHILLENDEIRESHKDCNRVQDPYSIRCIPQVHGAFRMIIEHVKQVLEIEINSATDNPLIFAEQDKIISAGNFHGQPIAFALDYLALGCAEMASISERRIEKLINPALNQGLPAFLTENSGLNSGFMIPHVAAASLVSENKIYCHPASIDSIPTSADKEDHVSMGTIAANKCIRILENSERVLAIEALAACQGLEFLKPLQPGKGGRVLKSIIREKIPYEKDDHVFRPQIEYVAAQISNGQLLQQFRQNNEFKLLKLS